MQRPAAAAAGAGVYTLELGRALAAQPGIDVVAAAPEPYAFGGETTRPKPAGRGRQGWEMVALSGVLARSGADVYHGPHFFVPHTVVPAVATVHDLTFYRLRDATRSLIAATTATSRAARNGRRESSRHPGGGGRHRPRLGAHPRSPKRLARLAPATGGCQVGGELALEAPYLCLGTAEPGKRAVDAIRAMPAIPEQAPGTVLALAGNPGRLSPRWSAKRLAQC
jgi:hypothetical protein